MLRLNTGATNVWNADNPQVFVYLNGVLTGTMDMNHHELLLEQVAQAGKQYNVRFYAYSNYSQKTNFFHLTLHAVNPLIEAVYYDFKVAFEVAALLREDDERKILLYDILTKAALMMDLRNGQQEVEQSICDAGAWLRKTLEEHRSESVCEVYSIGHTHIDVAWKWPLRQTREKAARSFQTVLSLMKEYPEYVFMSSQPQLYQFVKEDRPALYKQIKERVKEGRWETEGAMWLGADCNLSSGESLVRHILHGKRFFKQEFGCDENLVLWLPDVFGYSAALPQIMKKSGVKYFMTTKISWNDTNKFPYDTVYWEGIDGSRVLSHFITTTNYVPYPELSVKRNFNTTYNGLENASQVMGSWQRYQNKDISKKVLTCYGYGDGGGGTTREMIEQGKRLQNGILNLPRVRFSTVRKFFEDLEQELQNKQVPSWYGELYLEFHRGTYTSMGAVKQKNRQCEFLLQNTETLATLASETAEMVYPHKELDAAWKLLLLNQFHDILPGSSIEEVYTQAAEDYQKIERICTELIDRSFGALSSNLSVKPCDQTQADAAIVWNPLSFGSDLVIELDGKKTVASGAEFLQDTAYGTKLYRVQQVPAKAARKLLLASNTDQSSGAGTVLAEQEKICVETEFYSATVSSTGGILRLYDKEQNRDLFAERAPGNCFKVFDDRPNEYDSWNIDASYSLKSFATTPVCNAQLVEDGEYRKVIRVRTKYRSSTIEQNIIFYLHSRRIDFETKIDWQEHQHLLKAEFPFQLFSRKISADIQFGNVERQTHKKTSREQAQFEMCAHKWVDCSENGYGAALLNDSKYGYSAEGATISLTLLKSGIYPNENCDIGHHAFTYSLYPHKEDFRTGGVVQQAYRLNCKPITFFAQNVGNEDCLPSLKLSADNIICETIKKAESGEGVVVRMYECYGCQTTLDWEYDLGECQAFECDLLERVEKQLPVQDGNISCVFAPYEIKTFLLKK